MEGENMKIVGVSNPCGFNFLRKNSFGPKDLNVVYQDEAGEYYMKFLDSGDLILLLNKLDYLESRLDLDEELRRFLNGLESTTEYPKKYLPIMNEYFYAKIGDYELKHGYVNLADCPQDKLFIEPDYKTEGENFNQAVYLPNNDLYIGQYHYIYENVVQKLTVDGKSILEIEAIIRWLISNMYLDEAYNLIEQAKEMEKREFIGGDFVLNDIADFIEDCLEQIEKINFVKTRTRSINYKIFDRK